MASNRKRTPEVIDLLSADSDEDPPLPASSKRTTNNNDGASKGNHHHQKKPAAKKIKVSSEDEFNSRSMSKSSSSYGIGNGSESGMPSRKILLTNGKERHELKIANTTSLSSLQDQACNLFGYKNCILKYGVPPFRPLDDVSNLQHRDKIRVEGTEPSAVARKNNNSQCIGSSNDYEKKPPATKTKKFETSQGLLSNFWQSTKASASNGNSTDESGMKFRAATYNVWFGQGGDGEPYPEQRMLALTQALLAKQDSEFPLYFVGFQEVTPTLWSRLKPAMESAGYKLISQDLSATSQYGCALAYLETSGLTALSYGWQPYRSTIMGRGFLYFRAQLPKSNKQILFTTTHLESFVGNTGGGAPYTGSPEREQQVKELSTFCANQMSRFPNLSLAIISGDLNWDDERVQSKGNDKSLVPDVLTTTWKDTWFDVRDRRRRAVADRNGKVKKKDEPQCYTYDAKESAMLGGNLRRRFDRILTRQKDGVKVYVEDTELIGRSPIEGLTWRKQSQWNGRVTSSKVVQVLPSDHYGYVVTLTAS